MNTEDTDDENLKKFLTIPNRKRKEVEPVSIERGVYKSIRGSVDEETLLIMPTDTELEEAYVGVVDKVYKLIKGIKASGKTPAYKIFCFIHLNSKQGPKVDVPGILVDIDASFSNFLGVYEGAIAELENRYIGGEEYNEQALIISRVINVQFTYQVWER